MAVMAVATAVPAAMAAEPPVAAPAAQADSTAADTTSVEVLVESLHIPLDEGILQKEIVYSDRLIASDYVVIAPVQVKVPGYEGLNIYFRPYSMTTNEPNWGRYWANIGFLAGMMGGTLGVLECLPEDATSWNRRDLQSVPPFKRWFRNVFKRGPEIDHDEWVFNYLLHPYAGAAYFMAARTVGFNFWRSMLTSAFVSTVFWEFGIEAFMERPSYQDLVITPVVGSIIGELFYRLKRDIVAHDYHLWGSRVIGGIVAFLIDPVNEFLDLFRGNPLKGFTLTPDEHKYPDVTSSLTPAVVGEPRICPHSEFLNVSPPPGVYS